MPAAFTRTRTSPAPGLGRSTSTTFKTSMSPYRSNCTAFMGGLTIVTTFYSISPSSPQLRRWTSPVRPPGSPYFRVSACFPLPDAIGCLTCNGTPSDSPDCRLPGDRRRQQLAQLGVAADDPERAPRHTDCGGPARPAPSPACPDSPPGAAAPSVAHKCAHRHGPPPPPRAPAPPARAP